MFLKHVFFILILLTSLNTFSQTEILVPFRSGNVWGLADTNMQVVVEPKYDSIAVRYSDPKGYFKVLKNGKYGVITTDEVIIPPSLTSVFYRYGFIYDVFPVSATKNYAVYYNRNGTRLFKDTVTYVSRLRNHKDKYLYVVNHIDGTKSVFAYDNKKQELISWVLRNTSDRYLYSSAVKGKLYIFAENNGQITEVYEVVTDELGKVRVKMVTDSTQKEVLTEFDQEIYDDVEAEMDIEDDYDRYSKGGGAYHIQVNERQYMIIHVPGKKRRYYYYQRPPADLTPDTLVQSEIPSKRFEIVKYRSMVKGATNEYFYPFRYNRERATTSEYITYTTKKKIGVITALGNLPAEFDTVYGMSAQSGKEPRFIVGQRLTKRGPMLYGVLSARGDTIVPINKTDIQIHANYHYHDAPNTSGYITTEVSGQQSYYNTEGTIVLSELDSIYEYPHQNGALILVKDNLNGYHRYRHHINPAFRDIPVGHTYFQRYKVVMLLDNEYRFIGYGKPNGEVFYQD